MAFPSIVNAKKTFVDSDDRLRLICADVLDGLRSLDDDSVDLTVTSPPYNFGIDYDGHDDNMADEDYWKWLQDVWGGVFAKTKDCGRICVNGPLEQPNKGLWAASCLDTLRAAGWQYMSVITWHQDAPSGRTAWGSFASPSCPHYSNPDEVILVCYKGSKKNPPNGRTPIITPQEFVNYTFGMWTYIRCESAMRLGHPAPFPPELPERCIKMYAYKGDTILDPFSGSGSTGVAALQCGCRYIGIDVSQKYMDLSRERLYGALTKIV